MAVPQSLKAANPADEAIEVTPDDNNDIDALPSRGLYVGGAGDLVVRLGFNDTPITFVGLLAGNIYPLQAKRVHATGTTATNLVALY